MEPLSIEDIVRATDGKLSGSGNGEITGVSVDSRTIRPGELFIAIRGERFDGHRFIKDAVAKGAGIVISQSRSVHGNIACPMVLVEDTRKALGDIAKFYRSKFRTRVIAVTGSNGKTTTRDMIASILDSRFNVVKAEASYNNDIGVPLTVFRLGQDIDIGVFEIEMNVFGGTKRLAGICMPEIGVITNIGDTHLEFMHNRQGVAQEKAELLEALPKNGCAVLNQDDPLVMEIGGKYCHSRRLTFGFEKTADVYAESLKCTALGGSEFLLQGRYRVQILLSGKHNVSNCLGAVAVARCLGMEFADIGNEIGKFRPLPMRLRIRHSGDIVVIDDSYNANPQSVRAAFDVLCQNAPLGNRVAFLGDMLELGEFSAEAHTRIGRMAAKLLDRVVFVGKMAKYAYSAAIDAGMNQANVRLYRNCRDVLDELFDLIRPKDTILVKGSRAMRMELVAEAIITKYGKD
ncbi:hypothetical protein CH330_06910 [candidate division WOR-3 bacterium JGI_Cruoil_03_51_56]|uniref:UDP-N-acetylmuramoyl-tripeptide--D-alanyl-D-alanine ligase n=1 Tax=candidate division WOR-3 bacterium JGI_Cruoil_03_51_56 TaxID=1973747 RepID=A0A235BS40_UNCW3|nr:MAG: hypothetical protein CH330_06910 [candidate division WOR-3 bacterium JGI_Cruoil_03_51_56]